MANQHHRLIILGSGPAGYTADSTFTRVASLDFASLQNTGGATALNGNLAANRVNKSLLINLNAAWANTTDVGFMKALMVEELIGRQLTIAEGLCTGPPS